MDLTVWQPLAIALAIPVFTLITALMTKDRDPALYRRLRHSTTALSEVPENTEAREALDNLVVAQVYRLLAREIPRANRKLNKPYLALAVILAMLLAVILFGLISWVIAAWSGPFGWLAVTVSTVVALIGSLFVWLGFAQIYDPPKDSGGDVDGAASANDAP